nr:MAG TPA: hypothetical protein [Caudoviricetes sp.]
MERQSLPERHCPFRHPAGREGRRQADAEARPGKLHRRRQAQD